MNCESKCWFGVSYVNLRHKMLYGRSISLSNTQSWNWIVNCSQGLIPTMSIAYNFKELEIKAKFNFFRVFVHCVVFFFLFSFSFLCGIAVLVLCSHTSCFLQPQSFQTYWSWTIFLDICYSWLWLFIWFLVYCNISHVSVKMPALFLFIIYLLLLYFYKLNFSIIAFFLKLDCEP